jgi:Flp pilus assembly protein TadD
MAAAGLGAPSSEAIDRLRCFAIPAAVAVLTFLAFLPTLDNGFVEWDDGHNFLNNESYRGLGWTHLKWMFTAFHMGHYVPLTWITFGADYLLWGLDPLGYHLTSLVLHVANAVVFYLVARRLLGAAVPGANDRPLQLRVSAALAALVFSLHPLRVESVAWATERRDVLSGLFYLLAVLVYLRRGQDPNAEPAVWRRHYWACLALFVLALLSKSMAVTLPAVLFLLDVYPLRRFSLTPAGLSSRQGRWALLEKLPFFALSALASIAAFRATIAEDSLTAESTLRWVDRAAIAVYGLGFYVWKSILPLGLSPLYTLRIPFDPIARSILLSAVGVAALILLSAWLWRRTPAFLIAFAIYTVILLPVIGIFHAGPQIAADRYTYLAALPWAVLLGAALLGGWGAAPLASRPRLRAAVLAVAPCLLLIVLGILTWHRVQVWHDTESLWASAVRSAPSGPVHHALGRELVRRQRIAEALPHLRAAAELGPDTAGKHSDLAVALERLGRFPEATDAYARAVRESPADPRFRNYLGVALMKQGRFDEAVAELRRAVALRADSHEAHKNLGAALARQGKDAEAIDQFEEALRLSPAFADAHEGLGLAFMRRGDLPRAIREFRAALTQSRDPAEVRNNLGVALARQGDPEGAAREFRLAVELRPDFAAAQRNLEAALYEAEGRRRR